MIREGEVKEEKLEEPFGMMLTLKKRMSISERENKKQEDQNKTNGKLENSSQYLVMGSYDGLDLHTVNKWYEFRPKGVENVEGISSLKDNYADKYTLKLYFPGNYRSSAPCHDFNDARQQWKRIGRYLNAKPGDKKNDETAELLKKYPFLSLGMINLAPEFVKHVKTMSAMQEELEKCFCKVAADMNISLNPLHCAIFPCIGYADFIVLFLSEELKNVLCILDGIKKGQGRQEEVMISNCYSITGVYGHGVDALDTQKLDNMMASVRINLKTGVSADMFQDELNFLRKNRNRKIAYHVYGSADCLLIPELPLAEFLPQYFNEGLMDPNSDFFQNYIESTNTSLWIGIDDKDIIPVKEKEDSISQEPKRTVNSHLEWEKKRLDCQIERDQLIKEQQEEFKLFIDDLKKFVDSASLPVRSINALQKVYKRYLNLIKYPHCFDIEKVLEPVFEVFKENIIKSIKMFQDEGNNSVKGEMMLAINVFRERIGDYLADLQRSDRNFIEGQFLSHPSIASATKLLFFYNQFINLFAEKLVRTEREENKRQYHFVVISGGNDKTTSSDIFSYMDQSSKDLKSLMILMIPEMSLYDVQGTIFRLAHECFHFCGERLRKERLEAFIESLSRYFGWELAQIEFLGVLERQYHEKIDHIIAENIDIAHKYAAEKKIENLFSEQRKKLQEEVAQRLEERLRNEFFEKDLEEKDLYEAVVKNKLIEKLEDIFIEPFERREKADIGRESEDSFSREYYIMVLNSCKELSLGSINILKDFGVRYSRLNLMHKDAVYYLEQVQKHELNGCCEYDDFTKNYIEYVFTSFAGCAVQEPEQCNIEEEILPTVFGAVENLVDAAKEAYCDSLPIQLFHIRWEDFVLAFVYEMWDLEEVFPDSTLNTLRVITEFVSSYHINRPFDNIHMAQMEERIKYWEERGFRYRVHADALTDCLGGFFKNDVMERIRYFLEPIIDYIDKCQNYYDERKKKDFKEECDLYNKAKLENKEELYEMLEQIVFYWSKLAK